MSRSSSQVFSTLQEVGLPCLTRRYGEHQSFSSSRPPVFYFRLAWPASSSSVSPAFPGSFRGGLTSSSHWYGCSRPPSHSSTTLRQRAFGCSSPFQYLLCDGWALDTQTITGGDGIVSSSRLGIPVVIGGRLALPYRRVYRIDLRLARCSREVQLPSEFGICRYGID